MRKMVLWGHDMSDYRQMFDLTQDELNSSILEYGCGPSDVNVEKSKKKQHIISCDPMFVLDKETLASKVKLIFANMADEVQEAQDYFDFSHKGSLKQLISDRQKGMDAFFADYELGKKQGRYLGVTEYRLPFEDFSFNYALVSHYLFADLDSQSVSFYLDVIRELARVAKEVRIFPLIDHKGKSSGLLGPVLLGLQEGNYGVEVRTVHFPLHQSDNAMLRVWAQHCEL